MNVLPLQFHHSGVTDGLRRGNITIKNCVTWLRLHNHFLLKTKAVTQAIASRNTMKHGDTVESEQCERLVAGSRLSTSLKKH